jgi:uracil-DNA glycosylase
MQENFNISSFVNDKLTPAHIRSDTLLTWSDILSDEKEKEYFKNVIQFINNEKAQGKTIFPPKSLIFNALQHTPFNEVKTVILGQDPYHGPGQAHGLSFSVPDGVPLPPSLKNIYKEIESDLGIAPSKSGNLLRWAKQGVLLLNAVLSVEASRAGSHADKGWEIFTDKIIESLATKKEHLVFILWGNYARKKASKVDPERHLILASAHPSPLSAHNGFFGCKHFSKCNEYLRSHNICEIDW